MDSKENIYSSESSNEDSKLYESTSQNQYTSESSETADNKEDIKKYNIAKPKRIIIKARLIND